MTDQTHVQEQPSQSDLVGPGKKYASFADLEKAYLNADTFIQTLKGENEEMRSELQTRLSVEDQLKMFNERKQTAEPNTEVQNQPAPTPPVEAPTQNNDDIGARIREAIAAEKKNDIVAANIKTVTDKMIEIYGDEDKANEAVNKKAEEMGLPLEFLQSVAAQSPKAFFAQFGLDVAPRQAAAPRSEINTAALVANAPSGQIKEGTRAWYDQMRKTDPKRYFSGATHNQMMKDRTRLGDAFYN